MKLTVCVETVYTECRLPQRIVALQAHGVDGFELWGLENHSVGELQQIVAGQQTHLSLFCGNRRFSLIDPEQRPGFLEELAANLRVAQKLNCPSLTLLSDAVDHRGIPIPPAHTLWRTERLNSLHDGLLAAVALAAPTGVRLCVEPLNSVLDHPGYTLDQSSDAFEIVRAIGDKSLRVLFDVYHMQMMQVHVVRTMEENMEWIGHVHIADVPGRHEPGTGQIDFARIARLMMLNDYVGCIGLECIPAAKSAQAIRRFVTVFEPCMAIGSRTLDSTDRLGEAGE